MGMDGIGGGLGLSKMINIKDLIKRQTEPLKKVVSEKTTAKDLEFEKVNAYNKLETLLGNFRESLSGFRAGFNNSLDKKIPQSHTTDLGDGNEYITVLAKDGATGSAFSVSVNQLAKPASLVLGVEHIHSGSKTPFNFSNAQLYGEFTIEVGSKQAKCNVKPGDSVADIVDTINRELIASGIKAKADYNRTPDDKAYIDITGDAGESDDIIMVDASFSSDGSTPFTIDEENQIRHQKAQVTVTVGGVSQVHTSDSNIFKDVRKGIDIIVQKANTPGKDQTVDMVTDSSSFADSLMKLAASYNELKAFTASQSQKESIDPKDSSKKIPTPLFNSTELSQAKDALMQIETAVGDKSLESVLGIGFRIDPSINAPAGTKFMTVVDNQKLRDAVADMSKVKGLFSDMWEVTTAGDVSGATMQVASIDGRLPSHLQGSDIALDVTLDNAGSVTKVEATLKDGLKLTGKYDVASKRISFDNGSLLQHLNLSFDAGVAVNKDVKFSLKASNGIADLAGKMSDQLLEPKISSNGVLKNSIEAAVDKVNVKLTSQTEEIGKIQEKIKSIKDKAKSDMIAINAMDIMGGIMASHIQRMFSAE